MQYGNNMIVLLKKIHKTRKSMCPLCVSAYSICAQFLQRFRQSPMFWSTLFICGLQSWTRLKTSILFHLRKFNGILCKMTSTRSFSPNSTNYVASWRRDSWENPLLWFGVFLGIVAVISPLPSHIIQGFSNKEELYWHVCDITLTSFESTCLKGLTNRIFQDSTCVWDNFNNFFFFWVALS